MLVVGRIDLPGQEVGDGPDEGGEVGVRHLWEGIVPKLYCVSTPFWQASAPSCFRPVLRPKRTSGQQGNFEGLFERFLMPFWWSKKRP
jgi:hypothetical protein